MALDGIGGVRPGQPPAGNPLLPGDIALTNAQALGTKLRSGEIVSARVGADLGGGNVTLTVRGQTVVANSQMPLQPDTIVRLMVQSAGDQPVMRILGSQSSDLASLSTPAARAAALGLTSTPLVQAVLDAFENTGAPLDPARLRDAVAQLQRAPAGEIPQRAQALALLAQAGLPTTPPFVALAQRSAAGVLPNPAAAVAELQRASQATPATAPTSGPAAGTSPTTTATTPPVVVPPGGQSAAPSTAAVTTASTAVTTTTITASTTTALATRPAEVVSVNAPSAVVTPASPNGGQPTAAGDRVPVAGGQSAGGQAATSQAAVIAGQVPQVAGQPAQTGVAPTGGTSPSAAITSAPVSTGATIPPTTNTAPTAPPSPTVSAAVPSPASSSSAPATTTSMPLAPGAPATANAALTATLVMPTTPTTHTLAGTIVPDLARGGATAVLQALALAGVRPRDVGELPVATSAPTLLHRLDVPVEEAGPIRASVDTGARQPPPTPLDAAVIQVMREQAAETVVKPQALVDYDVVLGLPLQIQGQPLPARLAVAERQTSGGRATFLRVDAELTHLGPLSVRISGIENGPMAITVLASGPALSALAEALPDLTESLRALGLTAGLRVADLAEDLAHG